MEHITECKARFEFCYPNNLTQCPHVLLICRNTHSHVDQAPSKTPWPYLEIFNQLLLWLDWRLADATPWHILIDVAFMTRLCQVLSWVGVCDPILANLHPPLANSDHVAWIISVLWYAHFPEGTGFDGKCSWQIVISLTLAHIRCTSHSCWEQKFASRRCLRAMCRRAWNHWGWNFQACHLHVLMHESLTHSH